MLKIPMGTRTYLTSAQKTSLVARFEERVFYFTGARGAPPRDKLSHATGIKPSISTADIIYLVWSSSWNIDSPRSDEIPRKPHPFFTVSKLPSLYSYNRF